MRILIIALLVYLFYRVFRKVLGPGRQVRGDGNQGAINEMVQDPVCKTYVPLRDARRKVFDGREYFFCSEECADIFEKERSGS